MTMPKFLMIFAIVLFCIIGIIALFKGGSSDKPATTELASSQAPLEVELDGEIQEIAPALVLSEAAATATTTITATTPTQTAQSAKHATLKTEIPHADRINELFNKQEPRLSIVETIAYKSHVPWQKGRPAWLSDYAAYYNTSRHFIARSLNGRPDYLKQELKEGDRFNVFRKDRNFRFHLIVDTSRCKMWFYCLDLDKKEKILLKTYNVGLGRIDSTKESGLLTPLGTYTLGPKIAIYKPKTIGTHQGKKIEMISVFGTRWIPFDKEIGFCTQSAKGFGIHGTPWSLKLEGQLTDSADGISKYESDGCIRLSTNDMEELFAIIITIPTAIEIVRDYSEANFAQVGF